MSALLTVLRRARRVPASGARGTSAVEYSLLVAAIAAVCAAIIFSVGVKIKATFDDTCQALATGQSQQSKPAAGLVGGGKVMVPTNTSPTCS